MPRFPDYVIQEVADKNDIYDVISQTVQLKKAGNSYIGLCPFHSEKTPSCKVNKFQFKCFGCGAKGNAVSFVKQLFNVDFNTAVQKLNDDFGLGLLD